MFIQYSLLKTNFFRQKNPKSIFQSPKSKEIQRKHKVKILYQAKKYHSMDNPNYVSQKLYDDLQVMTTKSEEYQKKLNE